MIDLDTVLIVGAGASCPYGFPTGENLRAEIIQLVEMAAANAKNKNHVQTFIERHTEPHILRGFAHDFAKSPRNSIDIFIEGRPEFKEVGKLAIAAILCGYEREKALCGNDKIRDEDWLKALFNNYLVESGSKDEIAENKLKIITFNYDRSIEHRLTHDIHRTFGGTINEARELARKVEVIHVHGQLGAYFPAENTKTIEFDSSTDEQKLLAAAEGISYFFEPGDDLRLQTIRTTIAAARRIGFLGFGYDSVNLKRIIAPKEEGPIAETDRTMADESLVRLNWERRWKADRISGTSFGLPSGRKAKAKSFIDEVSRTEIVFEDCKCREFIENTSIFF